MENGTITIATLELLEKHENQFLKLGEIHQNNKNVQVSIKNSFLQRRSEKKAFFTLRDDLECFINFSNSFISGMSPVNILKKCFITSLCPYLGITLFSNGIFLHKPVKIGWKLAQKLQTFRVRKKYSWILKPLYPQDWTDSLLILSYNLKKIEK